MLVVQKPLHEIAPYAKNARKIPQRAIDTVAKSIQEFGWQQPIVIDRDGCIIVGHVRRLAALQLGLVMVPCVVAENLTPAQVRQYRLMDNRAHDEASWDLDVLTDEMKELLAENVDLGLTGFTEQQIQGWTAGVVPEWTSGMPEVILEDQTPHDSINVQFRSEADRVEFLKLLGEDPARKRSIWFPTMPILKQSKPKAGSGAVPPGQYPVYVISKGRIESRLTVKALEALGVPYWLVLEPPEVEPYAAVIPRGKILTLPFQDLGEGSIPARNWVWEHSLANGDRRHWILDDNIDGFYRLNHNMKVKVTDENPFVDCERFADQYANVAIAGLNYEFFADRRTVSPPFRANTRVYSCILIDNAIPFRWRGRYNEDTDLCLRALKAGYCTVLFNAFLAKKMPTMKMTGGNTDELYQGDGRLKMAESLRDQHPDVVRVTRKWGRWQHHVDYRPFKGNKFVPRVVE